MRHVKKLFIGLLLCLVVTLVVMYRFLERPRSLNQFSMFKSVFMFSTRNETLHNISESSLTSASTTSLKNQTFLVSKPGTIQQETQTSGKDLKAQTTSKQPAGKKKLICITFSGRLGNQLFQYAAVLGLSRKLDRIPVYSDSRELSSALQHPPPHSSLEHKQRCQKADTKSESACCYFHKIFLELDPQKDYSVRQYLQSYKYFEGFDEEVKRAMRFKDSVQTKANRTLQELRKTWNRTLVGVHVRRGDYMRPDSNRRGYFPAPSSYFQNAMAYMRKRFGDVVFVVSVDNEKWYRALSKNAKDVVILKRQEAQTDMALLSSLDHVITSVGTYSWWVGYLCRGTVLYWKDFIKRGTEIGNKFHPDGSTFIYPGWIPL